MPHLHADTLSLRNVFMRHGESRFARPVAIITGFALSLRAAVAGSIADRSEPVVPRIRQDMDVRALEEQLAHAADHGDIERMQRAFERREAEGVHTWDWR